MARRQIPSNVVLRHDIGPGDIGHVIGLHGTLYAREYGWDYTFEVHTAAHLAEFCLRFSRDRDRLWIAEKDGQIIGCVGIVGRSESEAQLRWFLVEPASRGVGLGKVLLDEAIAFCRERGYKSVFLSTFSVLAAAGHLYKSRGFEVTEEKTQNLFGTTVTEQRHVLNL
jgi:N-acetylglutamate synthase-like GNAT family acetyltransferase